MRTVPGVRCTSSNAFNLIARTVPGFRYTSREAFYLIARTIPGFRFTSSKAFYLITTGDAPVRMLPTFPNSIFGRCTRCSVQRVTGHAAGLYQRSTHKIGIFSFLCSQTVLWTLYPVFSSIGYWPPLVLPLLIMIDPLHPVPRYRNLPPQGPYYRMGLQQQVLRDADQTGTNRCEPDQTSTLPGSA